MEKKFLGWIKRILPSYQKKFYYKNSETTYVNNLYTYDDILLRNYLVIASTGNLKLLIKEGESTPNELEKQWEKIIKDNSLATGSMEYFNYFEDIKEYGRMNAESLLIRSALFKLLFTVDDDTISLLNSRGYRIDTTSEVTYNASINSALKKAAGATSRISIKLNEIKSSKGTSKQMNLGEMVAGISAAMGFQISEDISLSAFNAYTKLARQKNTKSKKGNQYE